MAWWWSNDRNLLSVSWIKNVFVLDWKHIYSLLFFKLFCHTALASFLLRRYLTFAEILNKPNLWQKEILEYILRCAFGNDLKFDVFSTVHRSIELFHLPNLMHNSLFMNKCMLHYYPRHVSSINMPIFRRANCIHTASGIVALCKWLHSTPVESRLLCSLLSTGVLCRHL